MNHHANAGWSEMRGKRHLERRKKQDFHPDIGFVIKAATKKRSTDYWAGSSIAARMAIPTRSSIKVKAVKQCLAPPLELALTVSILRLIKIMAQSIAGKGPSISKQKGRGNKPRPSCRTRG